MIAGPRRPAPAKQSLCLSWCPRSSGRLSPTPRRSWRRRPRRAPSSDGGRDPAQAADPQADPAAAGRGLSGGGEHGRDRAQGGGCHQRLGGQVRTAAPSAASRGGTGRRSPKPASGAVPPRRREGESSRRSFYSNAHPAGAGVQPRSRRRCVAPGRSRDSVGLLGLARVASAGARVALGLTVRRPLDLGPALRTVEGEGGAARPCRCVRGEDAQSSSVR